MAGPARPSSRDIEATVDRKTVALVDGWMPPAGLETVIDRERRGPRISRNWTLESLLRQNAGKAHGESRFSGDAVSWRREAAPGTKSLRASEVKIHFEGVKAVDGVNLNVSQGEILGLIGPNGAGKTTFINAVSGFERLKAGQITVGPQNVTGWPPHRLARLGLVRTFQNVRLFGRLTVAENVEGGVLGMRLPRAEIRQRVAEALEALNLQEKADVPASTLPAGTAKLVSFARAIASRPDFLLLDEPSAGLNEEESDELSERILATRAALACGVVVVEHDMRVIVRCCDRVQVLNYGKTISVGTPDEVRADRAVREAYLGT